MTGVVPNLMLRPTGTPTLLRVTGEEKVPIEVIVVVLVAVPPCTILMLSGETAILKSVIVVVALDGV